MEREISLTENYFISKLAEAGDLSKDGIVLFDFGVNRILYFNPAAHSLIGPLSISIQPSFEELLLRVVPDDRVYVRNQFQSIAIHPGSTEMEFRLIHREKEGKVIYVCCANYVLSKSRQMILTFKDITRAKELEQFLIEFGTKKNTILETTTHHFNGAMLLMKHLTDEAQKSMTLTDNREMKDYLNLLRSNTEYCIEMINDLLKEEHQKSPGIAVHRVRTDIKEKIDFIYENIKRSYPGRHFILQCPEPFVYIHTDEIKVLQIINNLVSNAIKFTLAEKIITIAIRKTTDEVIISVADEGIGIPESLQPALFIKRGGAGRTGLHGEKSNGYGLSICKTLAESIDGRIEFDTEEGKGSVFYLRLPKLRQV